jgi:NIMA (never in mitosis gene a)-related kinase 1/4/5
MPSSPTRTNCYGKALINKIYSIVMDFADDGDLLQKIRKKVALNNGSNEHGVKNIHRFDELDVWSFGIQMIKGIKALHDKRILHRDLKSANIFTYSDGTVKIGDLNVSKIMKE